MNEKIEVNNSIYEDEFVLVDSKKDTGPRVNTESKTNSYFDGTLLELLAYSYLCDFITIFSVGVLRSWGVCLLNKYIYLLPNNAAAGSSGVSVCGADDVAALATFFGLSGVSGVSGSGVAGLSI